jgi:hypothetical protein
MSAETELYAALSSAAGVAALAGEAIYPDIAPQEVALPCIAFQRIGTEYINTIHGAVAAATATLEIWCMAGSRSEAEALADASLAAVTGAFSMSGRRTELDAESDVWATVLTVEHFS